MTEQTELDRTAEPAGDGLLEPHGLEVVGEAIEVKEPASPAGGEATPVAAEADAIPIETVEESTTAETVVADAPAEEAAAEAAPAEAAPATEEAAAEPADAAAAADVAPVPEATPAAERAAPRTVARLIADTLHAAGVKFAFTVPGESFLGILESFADAGIRVIATRHESGAAFMAEAYGQLTGRPAACLGTRAVGASNLAIGIHTARADSTPMFALIGQVERPNQGREAFQEVDLTATIGGLASWAGEIRSPEAAPALLGEATRAALTGRPGPVLISCPEDVLDGDVPTGATVAPSRSPVSRPDPAAVRSVIQLLASAERPVIVAGAGVLRSRCSRELVRFAELLGVPVVAAWRRADVFPNDHPLYLGMSGFFASPAARDRLATADALVALGTRLNEPTSLGYTVPREGLRWAHVDVEPRVAAAGLRAPDVAIESDAAVFLRAAVARLERGVLLAEVTQRREAAIVADRARHEQAAVVDAAPWGGPGVHPGRIISILRSVLPDEAIVTTDAGNFGGWLARGFAFRRPATFLGPTSGAMGYALPAAIAAAIVHRDRPVVAVAGDGGFAMTMVELETAVRERVRPISIVFDNERYGTIRMHQDRRAGGRASATDLGPIDFARAAEAFGARGVRVETTDAFESALRDAMAADRPTVLHLPLDRRWISVDETPTADSQRGGTPEEAGGAASGMQRDAGAATPGSHVLSATVDAEVSAMTEQPQSGSGVAGDRGPADEVPAVDQTDAARTDSGTHPASGMGDPERSDRDPGQRARGDDDWSASDAGVSDAATSFGPADAPSDPNDVGGN